MFKKSPLKATRLHQYKRRIRIFFGGLIIAGVAFVLFGLAWLSRIHIFALTNVDVSGTVAIDDSDIQSIAKKHLAGAYLSLFAKSNKLIYPKQSIEQDIRTSFPSIGSLEVHTKGNSLEVTLSERKPSYVWCTGLPQHTDTTCYFMDETGYIFSEAPKISGNVYLVFYGIITDPNPIGKTYLDQKQLEAVNTMRTALDRDSLSPNAYVAGPDDVRELELSQGGKIIFKADQDPDVLISSIELIKKNTHIFDTHGSSLDYVDFRFGNKVYYKFVGDNQVQSSP
jgi:cell division septal protein FtsQ